MRLNNIKTQRALVWLVLLAFTTSGLNHNCFPNLFIGSYWSTVYTYCHLEWSSPSQLESTFWLSVLHSNILYTYYIRNWAVQPFRLDYDLAPDTTYVVCVNFYTWVAGPTVKSRQIFKKLFHCNLIYFPSFCQKFAERKRKFCLVGYIWPRVGNEVSHLIPQHTTY